MDGPADSTVQARALRSRGSVAEAPSARIARRAEQPAQPRFSGEAPARPRPVRLLLLTSTLGSGHVRAAQAIERAFRELAPGCEVSTLDFWSLLDAGVAAALRQAYLTLVQEQPELYERAYQLDERTLRRTLERREALPPALSDALRFIAMTGLGRSLPAPAEGRSVPLDRALLRLSCAALRRTARHNTPIRARIGRGLIDWIRISLARRLLGCLRTFDPDVVVATQMHPAALLSLVKLRYRIEVPMLAVVTDYGLHDFWRQPGIDHYCVAHESIAEALAGELGAQRISATGMPLMPGFRNPPPQPLARALLQLARDRPVVLVLGGGLGLGVEAIAERLLEGLPDAQVRVVTGHNAGAIERLAQIGRRHPGRLSASDWTERMEEFLRAADVVIGKPGGLSTAEALACGRPLLATHSVRGQESFNLRFLEQHGVGGMVGDDELPAAVASLLGDRARLARTQQRAAELGRRDGALRIAQIALDHARRGEEPAAARGGGLLRPLVQRGLRAVDALYHARHELSPVGEILLVGRARYRGPEIGFEDGTRLIGGDWIGTLHFNNARFLQIEADSSRRAALRFARLMLDSLRALAEHAQREPPQRQLAVYHGLSWLGAHGQDVGFVTRPAAPGWSHRLRIAYFRLLVWAFAPAAQTRASARPEPTHYWLTRRQLLQRFGSAVGAREVSR